MRKIVIAIDGFSSCGKSSFAKEIANKYGYIFIDTGAMYRAVTFYALCNGYITNGVVDRERLVSAVAQLSIHFEYLPNGNELRVFLNGEDVSDAVRTLEVSSYVSQISSIKEVRLQMVSLQQEMGRSRGVVMDGRDIGTVVFPDAELKLFMTASVDVRADRRYKELIAKGDDVSLVDIKNNIAERDFQDQTRSESPLIKADDAIVLDNSTMTIAEQMQWVDRLIAERLKA